MERRASRHLAKDLSITTWGLVLMFAILSSGAAYYVLLNRVENYTVQRVQHLTQEVARQSSYTLLVAETNPSAVDRFVSSFFGVNDVRFAALLTLDGRRVASVGKEAGLVEPRTRHDATQTIIIKETSNDVHLLAPVFLKTEANAHDVRDPLGYVYVIASKETARRLALNVSLANIAIVVVLGSTLLMWASKRTRRLTLPLEQLVATMNTLATTSTMRARAEVRGAVECRAAATAFNALMDRLKEHQDELRTYAEQLEEKVAERTKELQTATTAAKAATRYKSEVMSAVTHEMKAPLYVIGVYAREAAADLEMMESDTTGTRDHLMIVIREAQQLSEKISQILDVARLDKGAYEIKPEWTDLEILRARLVPRLESLAKTNRNTFSCAVVGRVRVWTDANMLEQIVMTIGTNACKFTRDGKVHLTLTTTPSSLVIEVEDTGAGIPTEILPTVFEEFRQGEMGEARGFAGTGLGLSIAKRYTDLLQGSISIASEVKCGTRVRVEIPIITPVVAVSA